MKSSPLFRSFSRSIFVLLAAGILFCFSLSSAAQQTLQVLHGSVRAEIASGRAELKGALPPTEQMRLSILLPLRNQAALSSLLARLYDPSSPDFHHWMSVPQFTEQFGPTSKDYEAVVEFARANGFTVQDRAPNRLLVPMTGSVAQVERAFHVSMKVYQHPLEKRTFYSADRMPSFNLPVAVDKIVGFDNYEQPRSLVIKRADEKPTPLLIPPIIGSGPGGAWGASSYLPGDMRAAYYADGVSPITNKPLTGSGQAVGMMEFAGFDIGDVTSSFIPSATATANNGDFVLAYTPVAGGTTYSIPINTVLLDGIVSPGSGGMDDAEPVLDIVSAIGMAPGLSQVRIYYGSSDLDIYNSMATENICKQLSVSWIVGYYDSIFQEYAAQGQSLFAASGDSGNPPISPAEDPWVTAVGGTHLLTDGAGGAWKSEYGWSASGAGPSPDNLLIPTYQDGLNGANGASTTLRNVPDVVIEGANPNYGCVLGVCDVEGGTSYSAPRYAALIAMANEQEVAQGRSTLGFINPAIYALAENPANYIDNFHDITTGTSACCGQPSWYLAGTGYDLVTGWGSPIGQNLINALTLPPGFSVTSKLTTLTLTTGQSGTGALSITAQGGYSGAITFACTGLPNGARCDFSPSTVLPTGSIPTTTTVTVTAPNKLSSTRGDGRPILPGLPSGAALATLALCFFGWKRGRWMCLLLALMIIPLASGLSGCSSNAHKPITSVVTITATSGTLQHATSFTLTVQ